MLDPTSRTLKQEMELHIWIWKGFSLLKQSWLLVSILSLQSKKKQFIPQSHWSHAAPSPCGHQGAHRRSPVPAVPTAAVSESVPQEREVQPFSPSPSQAFRQTGAGRSCWELLLALSTRIYCLSSLVSECCTAVSGISLTVTPFW